VNRKVIPIYANQRMRLAEHVEQTERQDTNTADEAFRSNMPLRIPRHSGDDIEE
jgi:hypothetical protein